MKILTLLHRWVGGFVGLLLATLGLSGAILVWEGEWIGLRGADDAVQQNSEAFASAVTVAANDAVDLSRITFASQEIGLHQAIYADGSGAYITQSGAIVERWGSNWERPELWIFDLHHYLLAGESGKLATGILGLIGVFFVLSGAILWWRTRRTFAFRLWPARLTRSAIVRQHRDLGILAAPLLLLSLITGIAMIFPSWAETILSPWSGPPATEQLTQEEQVQPTVNQWKAMLDEAGRRFPNAELRRLQFPGDDSGPVLLRVRQPFEWTPNGRTYLRFELDSGALIEIDDSARAATAQSVQEKIYPLHSGKVGGWVWKLVLTLAGLALTVLGLLTAFSFWFKKSHAKASQDRALFVSDTSTRIS